jgi:starch phosphorylase
LKGDVNIVYLPNYDMALAQQMVSGVDLWLNTPQPPLEASGTSGMKAALNGSFFNTQRMIQQYALKAYLL